MNNYIRIKMKEGDIFETKYSDEGDIQMVLANLFQAYGETYNNIKTIMIEELVNNLKINGSTNDLTKRAKDALRDIQRYKPNKWIKGVISTNEDFNTVEMDMDPSKLDDLHKLQEYIGKRI